MKNRKLLGILLAMITCMATISLAGCFYGETESPSNSSSSSSSSNNRDPWYDQDVDPDGWT